MSHWIIIALIGLFHISITLLIVNIVQPSIFSYIFQTIRAYLPLVAGRPQRKKSHKPQNPPSFRDFWGVWSKKPLCDYMLLDWISSVSLQWELHQMCRFFEGCWFCFWIWLHLCIASPLVYNRVLLVVLRQQS